MDMTTLALADDPGALALANGQIRKNLGLSVAELSVGLNVAKAMLQRGAPDEALQIYLALVLCDPKVVDFQIGLANCALEVDQAPLALQAASVAVALAPTDPRGYLVSGRACIALGAMREAIEDFADAQVKAKEARDTEIYAQASSLLELALSNV